MRLEHHIASSIRKYPGLYKAETYEKSRLLVLNQIFLVIGNGYEWAETKNPKEGGYLLEPKHKRVNGEYVRCEDKPYGTVRAKSLDKDYFTDKIFEMSNGFHNQEMEVIDINQVEKPRYNHGPEITIRVRNYKQDDLLSKPFHGLKFYEVNAGHDFSPYPVCEYSAIMELYSEDRFIQADWLQGAIDAAKESIVYFGDENRYKKDVYYNSDANAKRDERQFAEEKKKGGKTAVDKLRKLWGYKDGETVVERSKRSWDDYYKKSIKFFGDFLKKYDTQCR